MTEEYGIDSVVDYTRSGEPITVGDMPYVIKTEVALFNQDDTRDGLPNNNVTVEGRMELIKAKNLEISRIHDYFVRLVGKVKLTGSEIEDYLTRLGDYAARSAYVRSRLSNAFRNYKRTVFGVGFDNIECDIKEPEGGKDWSEMINSSGAISTIYYEIILSELKVKGIATEIGDYLERHARDVKHELDEFKASEYTTIANNLERAREKEFQAYLNN